MTHQIVRKTGKLGGGVLGPVSLFALFSETEYCYGVLKNEAFKTCYSIDDIISRLESFNHLEQGGIYLYAGILIASTAGLAMALWYVIMHTFRNLRQRVRKWREIRVSKAENDRTRAEKT